MSSHLYFTFYLVYVLFLSKARIWDRTERMLWKASFLLLLTGLLADLTVQIHSLMVNKLVVHWSAPVILLTGIYLSWYWVSSKKIKERKNKKKADIISVAKAAKVSASTVSRYFNHPELLKTS